MLCESYLNNKAVTHKKKCSTEFLEAFFQEQRYIYLKDMTKNSGSTKTFKSVEIQGHPQQSN